MTEFVRVVTFALASYVACGSLATAWRERPGMPWHQVLRFLGLGGLVCTAAVFQAFHWETPLTPYTVATMCTLAVCAPGIYGGQTRR